MLTETENAQMDIGVFTTSLLIWGALNDYITLSLITEEW